MRNNNNDRPYCSDEKIIEMYWDRNEKAIEETDRKYKSYLYGVAYNILHDDLDCDECLNDTYLGTWNAIPPAKPSIFQVFIFKIMRNIAIVRYKKNRAQKRIPSEMMVSFDELDRYVPCGAFESDIESEYLSRQLAREISEYLRMLSERQRFIFISRYYCSDRISDIAQMLHVSDKTVHRELSTIRAGLRDQLINGGYNYEK